MPASPPPASDAPHAPPLAPPAPSTRVPWPVFAGAVALGAWLFAYKLRSFLGLAYTSDLFQFSQLATSWLRGHFLVDNCYGDHLSIHTYFFCPLLAAVVVPFGPAGLLLLLGIALGAQMVGLFKILRHLQLPVPAAAGGAALVSAMPFSLHVYQDIIYGFHVELLVPVLGIWLAYFLLRRSWPGALLTALVLIGVKEEEPLIAGSIATMVIAEDFLRTMLDRTAPKRRRWRAGFNLPAFAVLVLALAAIPVRRHVSRTHAPQGYSPGSFGRIRTIDGSSIDQEMGVVAYLLDNGVAWLKSAQVVKWLGLVLGCTFGLILLRPHFLLFGVGTTLISWLVQDDLFWSPRLAPPLAFIEVAAILGLAAAFHGATGKNNQAGRPRRVLGGLTLLVAIAAGLVWQFRQVPATASVYLQSPPQAVSAEARRQADELFTQYRQARRPGEAVIASTHLFRYADYRSLFWMDRLAGRPTPVWVLWEYDESPAGGARRDGYRLVGQAGRFALFRLSSP